ncbi:class I SAM-dependent methyltransferase [Shimia biformata]|uniref:class I SAM-dependent methyltransferase n=1 Tax=Shimia biformata TaxID=1294299 RepID=UPI001EF252E3|nr:class I SAM-dependent methyltransferase [Shimia biformata]
MDWDAFFTLHKDLPREGPGDPDEVALACRVAGTKANGAVLDAGSGPGGDIPALLQAVPQGRVHAVDSHTPFVEEIRSRFADDPRVTARAGDMLAETGPYDLIWSAGAVYFAGIPEALRTWRAALAPGGAIAFSAPCLFDPDAKAIAEIFFEGMVPQDRRGIEAEVTSAGFRVIASRPVSDGAWEAYFGPQEARIAALRPGADDALAEVLDAAETEIATWRAHRRAFGYELVVVKPA